MAAKPIERFVKKQIQEQGGWDRILERIASGEKIAGIARTLYRPDGPAIDRSTLSHMLHRAIEMPRVVEAQKEGASADAEHAVLGVEDAPLDRDAIQKAKVVADVKLRYAGLVDREKWGETRQAVNVQLNVTEFHLDALRHRIVEASRPLQQALAISAQSAFTVNAGDGSAVGIGTEHGPQARDTEQDSAA